MPGKFFRVSETEYAVFPQFTHILGIPTAISFDYSFQMDCASGVSRFRDNIFTLPRYVLVSYKRGLWDCISLRIVYKLHKVPKNITVFHPKYIHTFQIIFIHILRAFSHTRSLFIVNSHVYI